jgi:hypothetical protein
VLWLLSVDTADDTLPPLWTNEDAGLPPSRLAFSFGTCTLLFTDSGGVPAADDSLRAVPAVLVSEDTALAEFALPRMKVPPVAA